MQKIVDAAKDDRNVRFVVVFGSSVTWACGPFSDIDVYFTLEEEKKMPVAITETPQDRWNNFTVDDKLFEEIRSKGVVVYARDFVGQGMEEL